MSFSWGRRTQRGLIACLVLAAGTLGPLAAASVSAAPARPRAELAAVRLPFIENQRQVDPRVAYYAPTFAGTVFVTRRGELVYDLPARGASGGWSLVETFPRGRPRPSGGQRSEATVSSFVGRDETRWLTQAPTYEDIALGQVWRGVSVAVRASGRSVEKVFTVAPGAPVSRIRVGVRGAEALSVSADGGLVARTGRGDVTFTPPVAYQERDGRRHPVTVAYRARGHAYGFTVGDYDRRLPLVIDPLLQSTYLGAGGSDEINAIAISPTTGDVYVAGSSSSSTFPGTGGGAQEARAGGTDVVVARLNAALTTLVQATFLGGTSFDNACGLVVHPTTGDVYVVGSTQSDNFPGTGTGAQTDFGGGFVDAFVAQLSGTLKTLLRATYLGGDGDDGACAIGLNAAGDTVFVAGSTFSTDFPGRAGGFQQALAGPDGDAFVARLGTALTAPIQSTYLGGSSTDSAHALAVHPLSGEVYVAGFTASTDFPGVGGGAQTGNNGGGDGFVARLTPTLTAGALGQATYLGGEDTDDLLAIAINGSTGDVYVGGIAFSGDFPGTAGGAQPSLSSDGVDGVIARLGSTLAAGSLLQATYLGGNDFEIVSGLAIHPATGDVYAVGETHSDDFAGTLGGAQPARAGFEDAFVARLRGDLTVLRQATYLGGTESQQGRAIAIHPFTGEVYAAGETESLDFPGTAGGAQSTKSNTSDEGFVARLTANLLAVDAGPDVTLTKTHVGDFAKGQIDATYTITVRNAGVAFTFGTVTVTDTLPAGLTATSLDGPGWACVLATLTCTRADALASGTSYPVITLTVTVEVGAPDDVINTATVSGGGDVLPSNNTAVDPTTIISFADVPTDHPLFPWIQALAAAGISGGCAPTPRQYCPAADVTREQMAVFLLRGIHGAGFVPPPATGTVFADVPADHPFADFIEQLFLEGVTSGCATDPARYCPDVVVTRAQMAVFLLRAKFGAGFVPPPATGTVFEDVPADDPFAPWIEELALQGITGGCSTNPRLYCPGNAVTRGQMAVFLARTFELPL